MIFKAIVVPTPRRILKFFEDRMDELNTESLSKEEIEEEIIETPLDEKLKAYGLARKLF